MAKHLPGAPKLSQLFIAHPGEDRVHHPEQTDPDRHRGASQLNAIQCRRHARPPVADEQAERHRQKDPERKKAIEKGKTSHDAQMVLLRRRLSCDCHKLLLTGKYQRLLIHWRTKKRPPTLTLRSRRMPDRRRACARPSAADRRPA